MSENKNLNSYDESSIKVLDDRDSVRLRPWMYIWSTSKTWTHHLVWEIINNSVDEAMAGHWNIINVILNQDGSISIEDFWRWIPYKPDENGKSTLETILTVLHSGWKFDANSYKTSGWLHWVWSTVTNYLSEFMSVEVKRDWQIHRIAFAEGILVEPIHSIWEIPLEETWTKVTFKPSKEIFSETEFDVWVINNYLEMQSYLLKWLKFVVKDETSWEIFEFYSQNGLLDYLVSHTENKWIVNKAVYLEGWIDFKSRKGEDKNLDAKVAFQWIDGNTTIINSFVNGAHTTGGGSHVEWFKNWVKRALDKWLEFKKVKIKDLSKEDMFIWFEGILSANFFEPEFEWQTKGILWTKEVLSPTSQVIFEKLYEYLELNPSEADKIVKKIQLNVKLRLASENAQKDILKNKREVLKKVINRYWGCSSRNPKEKELYIVEWNSAAGSVVDGRDPKTQWVLGLRWVVLNTEGKTLSEIIKNAEIQTILAVLDCGIGKNYDENKLQFDKIIIAADADPDGCHIESLVLTFLYRFLPQLFENGHVYTIVPPLYQLEHKGKKHVFYNDKELEDFKLENPNVNSPITRFKWLWEMNPEEAGLALCNKSFRKIEKIKVEDNELFSQVVSDLMGPNSWPKYNLMREMRIDRELLK